MFLECTVLCLIALPLIFTCVFLCPRSFIVIGNGFSTISTGLPDLFKILSFPLFTLHFYVRSSALLCITMNSVNCNLMLNTVKNIELKFRSLTLRQSKSWKLWKIRLLWQRVTVTFLILWPLYVLHRSHTTCMIVLLQKSARRTKFVTLILLLTFPHIVLSEVNKPN